MLKRRALVVCLNSACCFILLAVFSVTPASGQEPRHPCWALVGNTCEMMLQTEFDGVRTDSHVISMKARIDVPTSYSPRSIADILMLPSCPTDVRRISSPSAEPCVGKTYADSRPSKAKAWRSSASSATSTWSRTVIFIWSSAKLATSARLA